MEKIKVQWFGPSKSHIAQIFSDGLEYAFSSADGRQVAPFVFCKDFLQDCILGHLHNKAASIYSFVYDPAKQPPLDLENTRLLLTNESDNKFNEKVEKCLEFVNQIETKLKLRKTKVFECESPEEKYAKCGVYYFLGSGRWMNAPPLISLYSLLLRVGFVHKKGEKFQTTIDKVMDGTRKAYQSADVDYLKQAKSGIEMIMALGYRKIFWQDTKKNYPNISISSMHNNMGIVEFSHGSTKSHVPHWHRKKLQQAVEAKKAETA